MGANFDIFRSAASLLVNSNISAIGVRFPSSTGDLALGVSRQGYSTDIVFGKEGIYTPIASPIERL